MWQEVRKYWHTGDIHDHPRTTAVLNRAVLTSRGHLTMFGDSVSFQLSQQGREGSTGVSWVEAQDAAHRSSEYRTVPTTENYLVPKVNSAVRNCAPIQDFW